VADRREGVTCCGSRPALKVSMTVSSQIDHSDSIVSLLGTCTESKILTIGLSFRVVSRVVVTRSENRRHARPRQLLS
jgi:hypothetical protein